MISKALLASLSKMAHPVEMAEAVEVVAGPDEEMERCTEKHKHHTAMCRKAPTPASRALHRKLRDHYAAKIGK